MQHSKLNHRHFLSGKYWKFNYFHWTTTCTRKPGGFKWRPLVQSEKYVWLFYFGSFTRKLWVDFFVKFLLPEILMLFDQQTKMNCGGNHDKTHLYCANLCKSFIFENVRFYGTHILLLIHLWTIEQGAKNYEWWIRYQKLQLY